MKTKIRNVLIVLLGILVLGIMFNINQVRAEEVDEDYIKNIMDQIPDTMNIDIPEIEYEKAEEIVLEKIKNILDENNIKSNVVKEGYVFNNYSLQLSELTVNGHKIKLIANCALFYLGEDYFHKAEICINEVDTDIRYNEYTKNIDLVYSNTNKFNVDDEKFVKNFEFDPKTDLEINLLEYPEMPKGIFELAEKQFNEMINDESIYVKVSSGAGGRDFLAYGTEGTSIAFFKNGILYDLRITKGLSLIPYINIPSTVLDRDASDYAIKEIKKYCEKDKDFPKNCEIKLVKGSENYKDIKDIYTVNFYFNGIENEPERDLIIIRKETEKETIVAKVDSNTNIKLDSTTEVVPKDTTLEVNAITNGEKYNTVMATLGNKVNKFTLYDITLKSNGVKIQPSGKVKISIPVPEEFDKEKLVIYRINEDGTKVRYDINVETIEGKDYATFETDHFSLYTLVSEKTDNNNSNELNENPTVDKELDTTPKTGSIDVSGYAIVIVFEIVTLGMIILKKYLK